MSEITPAGVEVTGHATDIKGSVDLPGTREVLENMYNDFLDYKQIGTIPLDRSFESYISETRVKLESHWKQDITEKFWSGQMGKAEFEMWKEMRIKLIEVLRTADPRSWGFDSHGIQYIQPEMRKDFKNKVGKDGAVAPDHRPVKIKTGTGSSIIRP